MESTTQTNTNGATLALASEALDEEQIRKELDGHVIKEYVNTVQGKNQLSYAGVKAVAAKMAAQGFAISVEHTEISLSEDGATFRAYAIAKNLGTGEKRTGYCEQARFYDKEMTKAVPFAYVLAGTKAQRNAIRHHLPETAIVKAIEEWTKNQTRK